MFLCEFIINLLLKILVLKFLSIYSDKEFYILSVNFFNRIYNRP